MWQKIITCFIFEITHNEKCVVKISNASSIYCAQMILNQCAILIYFQIQFSPEMKKKHVYNFFISTLCTTLWSMHIIQ